METATEKREYNVYPSPKCREAFSILANAELNNKKICKSKALRKAGYSESVARKPERVLETKGFKKLQVAWQESVDSVDYHKILKHMEEIALSDDDKRNAINATNVVMKLGNKFPASRLETSTYSAIVNKIIED